MIVFRWSALVVACVAIGCTIVLDSRGHLAAGAGTAAVALLALAAARVAPQARRHWLDAKAEIRKAWEQEQAPEPAPRMEAVTVPRESRPPWDTATMPVVPVEEPAAAHVPEHGRPRDWKDVVMGALTAAAQIGLKD